MVPRPEIQNVKKIKMIEYMIRAYTISA